jgi:hypothetical protein
LIVDISVIVHVIVIVIVNIIVIVNAVFIIDATSFLVSHGNLILADLPALTSIDGAFDALQVIEGSVDVQNTGLTSFKGLETLTDILNTGGAGTNRTKFRADKLNPGLSVGIDFDDVLAVLEKEGVEKFEKSWQELVDTIEGQLEKARS